MKQTYSEKLTAGTIDRYSDLAMEFMSRIALNKKAAISARLSIEEVLLKWRESFGEETDIWMTLNDRIGIQLKIRGEKRDPFETEEDSDFGNWRKAIFSGLENQAVYSYHANYNRVSFKMSKYKINMLFLILAALAAAIIVGLAASGAPFDTRAYIANEILYPISSTYLNVLGFCGIPLIFLSIALGAYGIGDADTFGKIGRNYVLRIMLYLALSTILACLIALPFFKSSPDAVSTFNPEFTEIETLLLSFIPTNLLAPFLECNAMQLTIMGFAIGIAMIKIDPFANGLLEVFESLNSMLLKIFSWLTKLLPLAVFLIVTQEFLSGNYSSLISVWKPWVVATVLELMLLGVGVIQISVRHSVPVKTLVRKLLPTFVIALGTDSCTASIPENYSSCVTLGIDGQLFGFAIPVGTTIYKPASAIRMVVLTLFMASTFNIGITPMWVIMLMFLAGLLSVAVPAIPGGVVPFFAMLFTQLGIPAEAMTLILATDIFFDCVATAVAQTAAQLSLVRQADKFGLLDEGTLKKDL